MRALTHFSFISMVGISAVVYLLGYSIGVISFNMAFLGWFLLSLGHWSGLHAGLTLKE